MDEKKHCLIAFGVLTVVLAGPLAGCQTPTASQAPSATLAPAAGAGDSDSGPANKKAHDDKFIIGNDDVLSINVWNEPNLSHAIPVRSDGKISLPLVGELQASGKTPLQLEGDIAEKLKSFITSPQVSVMVQEIKSQNFNILGMVVKPGSYSLTVAPTIVDAIAAANGFKDFAKQKQIFILRKTGTGSTTRIGFNYKDYLKGKAENVKLEPGDTIQVP